MLINTALLKTGSIYHLLFAVFHLFWPKLFNWKENLNPLDDINKALLPIMSGLFIYVYTGIALASFFLDDMILNSSGGLIFLISVAGFWLIRTAMQFRYFNIREKEALIFLFIFIAGILLYAIPAATH